MTYRERLRVPGTWWVVGLFFAVSFVTAVGFYAGPGIAVFAGAVTTVGVAAALLWYGRVLIVVDEVGLRVGDAVLEWPYLGEATAHDRGATQRRWGPDADHAAWLAVRAYVPGSVEVTVTDAADPHPYWLVSSRNPAGLAAAIEAARPISPERGGAPGGARLPQ